MTPDSPPFIRVGKYEIGGSDFVVMAGPCAVESEQQIFRTAEAVARAGGQILRGGAFKPRTSPYAFQGLGIDGLKLLARAGREFGLPVVTEVMSDGHVETVAEYADILQIGSRSMENFALLHEVSRTRRPILMKRGMTSTVEEMASSAAFVIENGNPNVILCERGIRTFGTATRNTCDIVAVPLLQKITGLPVILDPSHATGVRELISPLARAAVAIGSDGLIIEVHPNPDRAWSDGQQSLSFDQFEDLMHEIDPIREIWHQRRAEVLATCMA